MQKFITPEKKTEADDDNLSDISNEDIKDIIKRSGYKHNQKNQLTQAERLQIKKNNQKYLMEVGERKWQAKHGRKFLINFDQKQRKEMKDYFKALDKKNNGSIGIQELEQLLVSVGLAQSREQVKKLIDSVDQDHSGKIEFDEFLDMIQSQVEGENQDIINFFKSVIGGTLDKDIPAGLSFQLMISNIRRKKMMNALGLKQISAIEKKDGMKVLQAYKTMNEKRMIRKIRQEQKMKALKQLKASNALSN